jgi:hypothetical protein
MRDFSWGKGGRCVRMMVYHPRSAENPRPTRHPLGHLGLLRDDLTSLYAVAYVTYERIFQTNMTDLGIFEYRVGLLRVYCVPKKINAFLFDV